MRKSDLKTGMRVMTRDRQVYLVLRDYETSRGYEDFIIAYDGGWNGASNYNDDLTNASLSDLDIIEVFELNEDRKAGSDILDLSKRHSIWKRNSLQDRLETIMKLNNWMNEPVSNCLTMDKEIQLAVYHTFEALKYMGKNDLLSILNNIVRPKPYKE